MKVEFRRGDSGRPILLIYYYELYELYELNNTIMEIKDLFRKKEMPADEEKQKAEQYAPLYEEPEDIKLFNVVRKLTELGAEFDIKACGLHITNKSNE